LANPEQLIARGLIIIAAVIFSARTQGRPSGGGSRWGPFSLRRFSGGDATPPATPETPATTPRT
jgi:hypothetical protein